MIDLRYLRSGDLIRVERGDVFVYGLVQGVEPGGSERFPEREIRMLPCVLPGTPYPQTEGWHSCTRAEVTGVWHADTQTRRAHQEVDAYLEWADLLNR